MCRRNSHLDDFVSISASLQKWLQTTIQRRNFSSMVTLASSTMCWSCIRRCWNWRQRRRRSRKSSSSSTNGEFSGRQTAKEKSTEKWKFCSDILFRCCVICGPEWRQKCCKRSIYRFTDTKCRKFSGRNRAKCSKFDENLAKKVFLSVHAYKQSDSKLSFNSPVVWVRATTTLLHVCAWGQREKKHFSLIKYPQRQNFHFRCAQRPRTRTKLCTFRYQKELPKKIKQRGRDAHLIHEELVQCMKWKQSVSRNSRHTRNGDWGGRFRGRGRNAGSEP